MATYEVRVHPSCRGCRFSSLATRADRQRRDLYCSDRSERVASTDLCLRFNPRVVIRPVPPSDTPSEKD